MTKLSIFVDFAGLGFGPGLGRVREWVGFGIYVGLECSIWDLFVVFV